MTRIDGRTPEQLRPVRITPGFISSAEGSVLIEVGRTRVICTASIEETVPHFMRNTGKGWITSEYSMIPGLLPRVRCGSLRPASGPAEPTEIQRLIGRSLRTAIDLDSLGERTIWMDCDVIEADGGTRTASITGAFVALKYAVDALVTSGKLARSPIRGYVAAVSVGVIGGVPMLDLNYSEDSTADVDLNLVMTDRAEFVEIQGTAERNPFGDTILAELLALGRKGISEIIEMQHQIFLK